ncbi:hypothetical protein DDW07_02600, partial [Acidilobus sp. SCGC AC-742_E15]
ASYLIGQGITGQVVKTGKPIIVPVMKDDPNFLNLAFGRPFQELSELSFISVPVLRKNSEGATFKQDGDSAVHSHMTNTLNTPVEALEFSYPFLVTEYSIRRGSGGKGQYNGGDGLIREIKLISDAEVTVLSERRTNAPYGLFGGESGRCGKNIIIQNGQKKEMPGKFFVKLRKGDILRIETPGGGGYGQMDNNASKKTSSATK